MNAIKKKVKRNSSDDDWRHSTGSFVRKPSKGWIHPEHLILGNGVHYEAVYVGSVKIVESVRTIPFNQRGDIVREAICRCCDASKLYNFKKNKVDGPGEFTTVSIFLNVLSKQINGVLRGSSLSETKLLVLFDAFEVSLTYGIIQDVSTDKCGMYLTINISAKKIKTYERNQHLFEHSIEYVSFAAIGEGQYKHFVGYISKDRNLERACFVFECKNGMANDIILTMGQAFELKYKQFIQKQPRPQPVVTGFTDPSRFGMQEGIYMDPGAPADGASTEKVEDEGGYNKLFVCRTTSSNSAGYASLLPNDQRMSLLLDSATGGDDVTTEVTNERYMQSMSFIGAYDDPTQLRKEDSGNGQDYLEPVDLAQLHRGLSIDLAKESWYHGKMSREDAEYLVMRNGDFLVRDSSTCEGQYVLTGMREGVHKHLLLVDPDGRIRVKDTSFPSISALVDFHTTNNIPVTSAISAVFLINKIPNRRSNYAQSFAI